MLRTMMSCLILFFATATLAEEPKPIVLFDGKTLDGWTVSEFAGHGDPAVEAGQIMLPMGDSLTGLTYARPTPKIDYEISLEAKRIDGGDFFCGLTFPVGNDFCSLIVGGWGGAVVGISSLDGLDASENETTSAQSFRSGQWYRIRLRVTKEKIQVWIDDKNVVDVGIKGKRLSIRGEVELSRPLGIASWQTTAALKNLKLTPIVSR